MPNKNARPLDGVCVILLRAMAQAVEDKVVLEGLGARVLLLPTIQIQEMVDNSALRSMQDSWDCYDFILFSSANAVCIFHPWVENEKLSLQGKKIVTVQGG